MRRHGRSAPARLVLALLAGLLPGIACGGDGGSADESTAPPPAGELPDDPRERVVEAVAPVAGTAVPSVRWLACRLYDAVAPGVATCLEDRGRADLVALMEQDFAAHNEAAWNLQYPEPERLRAEGFNGDGEVSPLDDWSDLSAAERDEAMER